MRYSLCIVHDVDACNRHKFFLILVISTALHSWYQDQCHNILASQFTHSLFNVPIPTTIGFGIVARWLVLINDPLSPSTIRNFPIQKDLRTARNWMGETHIGPNCAAAGRLIPRKASGAEKPHNITRALTISNARNSG